MKSTKLIWGTGAMLLTLAACHSAQQTDTAEQRPSNQQKQEQPKRPVLAEIKRDSAKPAEEKEQGALDQLLIEAQASRSDNEMHRRYRGVAAPEVVILRQPTPPFQDTENYQHLDDNRIKLVSEQPVSTFSIDVDTGSYSNVRRFLNEGRLPPAAAVRLEEMVNYFDYQFPGPNGNKQPFAVSTEVMDTPWNQDSKLLQIGIQGYQPELDELPDSNLVFLLDVSGSMNSANKLGLVKQSLSMLLGELDSNDRISIVVYAGASGVVLEPTPGNRRHTIERAMQQLQAGGSTNGAAGIELAYQMAEQAFIEDGINRIILATDGDFNVGTVNQKALEDLIERKRKTGIYLSTMGFGTGNYNDHLMEQLADKGNGNYAYIDTLKEARKVLVDERGGTLMTIAKDVKIQLEFNPAMVSEYRLLGYENRQLNREDFNNDKVDAGEIGAGHSITALYEIRLAGNGSASVDPLRYQEQPNTARNRTADRSKTAELGFLKLRYKQPDSDRSTLIETALESELLDSPKASASISFAAAVAGFAQLLKGGEQLADWNYDQTLALARAGKGDDENGYRGEFIQLVKLAESVDSRGNRVESGGQEQVGQR